VTELGLISNGTTPGTLVVSGGGTLQLSNPGNSYSGGTKVTGNSALFITAEHEVGSASGGLTLGDATSGGTLDTDVGITSARNITLGAGGGTINDMGNTNTFSGVISGSGALTKMGTGTLILSGHNGYTGNTIVTGGTISISSDANLGNGGTLALENGTGIAFTAGGSYTHPITVAGDPTFNVTPGQTVAENGPISDGATAGMVEVIGGGTLALTNTSNSYSGGTTVTGNSTLSINNDHDLGNASGGLTLGDATSGGTLAATASVTSHAGSRSAPAAAPSTLPAQR
jgi:autotransporter-associated beta strand protein